MRTSAEKSPIRAKRSIRAVIAGLVAALLATMVMVGGESGAGAQRAAVAPVAVVPPAAGTVMPGIDGRLLGVPLLPGTALGADVSAELAEAQTRLAALRREQATLNAKHDELQARARRLSAEQRAAQATLERTQALVDRVAAAAYRGASDELLVVLPSENLMELSRRMKLVGQVGTSLRTISKRATAARRKASDEQEQAAIATVRVRQRLDELAADLPPAEQAVDARLSQVANDLPARKVAGMGIPVAALDAYLRAERYLAYVQPTCGIKWWLLAGIADGESGHGTHGGARADVNGNVFPPIIGIPLDGTHETQAIADTDKGVYDKDLVWDRAVGVLQFIPGTWKRWASDGNGDTKTDPQNLYDAALGAARKLCADAGSEGLNTDAQIAGALRPYAVTAPLVRAKLARARAYELQGLPKPDATVAAAIPAG